MKNIFFYVGLLLLVACNNSGNPASVETKDTSSIVPEKTTTTPAADKVVSGGACARLVSFQKGAEIEATSFTAAGEPTAKQVTKVIDVKEEGGITVAYVEGTDVMNGTDKTTTVQYNYKCDGDKIYFDIASMFRTAEKQQDASFESSMIEYPINIEVGQTIPDAIGTMSAEKAGKKMTMKYIYKDRKVEGKEDVTTPAGSWSCFKISNSVEVEMEIPGMDEKTKQMMKAMQGNMKTSTITWFAPDFGIVKMEMYTNGKLSSKNEVTAVRK
jgi:hypothetical protein